MQSQHERALIPDHLDESIQNRVDSMLDPEEAKRKLVHATSHLARLEYVKSAIAKVLGNQVKELRQLQSGLVEGAKFKTNLGLQRTFGSEWQRYYNQLGPNHDFVTVAGAALFVQTALLTTVRTPKRRLPLPSLLVAVAGLVPDGHCEFREHQ